MPKRIVHGEGIWESDKINLLSEDVKPEYANWYPKAEANGVFEINIERLHHSIYGFNRKKCDIEFARKVLAEFIQADLLRTWVENGKTFGWWVGSDKEGLLPKPNGSEIKKFRNLPPWPSKEVKEKSNAERYQPEEDETVKFKDRISKISREILHVALRPDDRAWAEMKSLVNQTSQSDVVDAFEIFARGNADSGIKYPLSSFLKKEIGYMEEAEEQKTLAPIDSAVLVDLCADLYLIAEQAFTGKYQVAIGKLLGDYTPDELKKAYTEFVADKDQYNLKFAPRDFVEGGALSILVAAKKRNELERKKAALIERTKAEMLERHSKEDDDDEEIFEGLPEV